jgi:hypothetical protein
VVIQVGCGFFFGCRFLVGFTSNSHRQ